MNKLFKFVSWNDALVDHFVKKGSTVWYVTDSVIEHIGKKYEIQKDDDKTFYEDFIKSILFVKNTTGINAMRFFEESLIPSVSKTQCKKKQTIHSKDFYSQDKVSSLMEYALFLSQNEFFYFSYIDDSRKRCDKDSKQFIYYPYFSYLIFILLGFNKSNNQKWDEVKRLFNSNGLDFANNDHPKVAKLFEAAIRDGLLNDNCVRTDLDYVKYLKYHSVLTPRKLNVLESVLYDHNIALLEGLRFNDIRNWIWRVSTRTALGQFRDELLKTENASYFLEIIKSFDREEYREKKLNSQNRQINGAERLDGQFRFVVDAEIQSLSVWVEGIKVNQELRNGKIKITPNYILPDNYIANIPDLSWGGYVNDGLLFKEPGICIKSASGRSCYYFEIVNNRWLVEVAEPDRLANRQCLFVINGKDDDLINRHNALEVTNQVLRFFLPTDWHLYVTNSYVLGAIDEDENVKDSLDDQAKFARVAIDDAIRVNVDGKLCFIAEMFPYIIFEGIEYKNIRIKAFDSFDKPINFKQKNIGDRIYLYEIAQVQSGEMIMEIYDEKGNRIDYNVKEKSHFMICSACGVPACRGKEYVKFDKWFCQTNVESNYYSNNRVYPLTNDQISWEPTTRPPIQYERQSYSSMMAVLYALGETRGHNGRKAIPNSVLESVFKYVADFKEISLDKFQMYRLKNALCELGVLTHYYDGGHYYQTNSACLIPTCKRYVKNALDSNDKGTLFYILSGAYCKTDYEVAINSAKYVEYVQQHDPLYSLLPPVVKVGYSNNIEESLSIPVNKYCTYDSLLGYAGNISEFDTITAFTENVIGSSGEGNENVPCIIPSTDYRGKREQLRIDNDRILVNPNLPLSLLRNYVNYKHNNPIWYESKRGEIFIKEEKAIPFFAKRALNSFSGNLSKEVYVFGVDNIIGNSEKCLFERLITYTLPTGGARNHVLCMLRNALGGETAPISRVTIPKENILKNLSLFVYKTKISDVNMWWLELSYKNNVVCFSDPYSREIYCLYNGGFHRMIRTNEHNVEIKDIRSFNERFSKVIKLYDDQYNFNVQDLYVTKDEEGNILKDRSIELDMNSVCTDLPSNKYEFKFKKEVIIIRKPYEK